MDQLRVGLIGEAITTVTEDLTAYTIGSGSLDVYATPAMIALMEEACVAAIEPYLSEGLASVGIEVHTSHLSATPIGENITAIAEISAVDGKRVTLEVRAWDEQEMIGESTMVRYIIDVQTFLDRLDNATDDPDNPDNDDAATHSGLNLSTLGKLRTEASDNDTNVD
jgi:fluoroacetyl-CoA thioesterase